MHCGVAHQVHRDAFIGRGHDFAQHTGGAIEALWSGFRRQQTTASRTAERQGNFLHLDTLHWHGNNVIHLLAFFDDESFAVLDANQIAIKTRHCSQAFFHFLLRGKRSDAVSASPYCD